MSWLFWLTLAVALTVIAAVTGIQPNDTRPVARTQMMGVGRVVLMVLVAIFAYAAFRARAGG